MARKAAPAGVLALAALLSLSGCRKQVATAELLDVAGPGGQATTSMTGHFTAHKAWTAKYAFDCRKHPEASGFGLDLHNADDDSISDQHLGFKVDGTKRTGTVDYQQPGEYYFEVHSACGWNLNVREDG